MGSKPSLWVWYLHNEKHTPANNHLLRMSWYPGGRCGLSTSTSANATFQGERILIHKLWEYDCVLRPTGLISLQWQRHGWTSSVSWRYHHTHWLDRDRVRNARIILLSLYQAQSLLSWVTINIGGRALMLGQFYCPPGPHWTLNYTWLTEFDKP